MRLISPSIEVGKSQGRGDGNTFIDYAEQEQAQDKIHKLKMQERHIDEYIAEFLQLVHRANLNTNKPSNIRIFARGLPSKLTEACIDCENPKSFEQWSNSAQRQQKNWLKKRTMLRANYETPSTPSQGQRQGQGQCRGQFFWCRGSNQGGGQPAKPRLPPRNENAMHLSTVCKATTEAEKEQHRKEGRCYECSQQGHLACYRPLDPGTFPPRSTGISAMRTTRWSWMTRSSGKIGLVLFVYASPDVDGLHESPCDSAPMYVTRSPVSSCPVPCAPYPVPCTL
jgi:hypothetical protein